MSIRNALAASVVVAFSVAAQASGGGFAGATEITQLANNAELVLSYVEQAQQTVTQINQYATMLRNLQRLTPNSLLQTAARTLWRDQNMDASFRSLFRIVSNGQRIAYSLRSVDNQMRTLNPGYGNFADFNYQTAYRDWSETTRSATTSALQLVSAHAEDFQTEADMIGELSSMSESVDGQVQAIQAGNQIGIAMVGQMQRLRQLQMAQLQAQQLAGLAEQGRREASDDMLRRGLERARAYRAPSGRTPDLFRGRE